MGYPRNLGHLSFLYIFYTTYFVQSKFSSQIWKNLVIVKTNLLSLFDLP